MPINLYFFHIYFYLHKCKQFLSKLGARPGTWLSPREIYSRGQNSQAPLWKPEAPKEQKHASPNKHHSLDSIDRDIWRQLNANTEHQILSAPSV